MAGSDADELVGHEHQHAVPAAATTGNVVVTVGGVASIGAAFTVTTTTPAQLTTPAPGSTLTASTVTFQWTGGTGVAEYG